jgi:hypothetical protein
MSVLSNTAKKIAFWNYSRTSWQWDVLCVLILVFIFLTPKSWFENREYRPQKTFVIPVEVIGTQADRSVVEQRARSLAGRPDSHVTAVRERRDGTGKVVGYEVDIR